MIRNRLNAEKVEAILFILQAYGGKRKIIIHDKLVSLLKDVEEKFYEKKKSKVRKLSPQNRDNLKLAKMSAEEEREDGVVESIHISLPGSQDEEDVEDEGDLELEERVMWDNIPVDEEKSQSCPFSQQEWGHGD